MSSEAYKSPPEFEEDQCEPSINLEPSDLTELWLIQRPHKQDLDCDGKEVSLNLNHNGILGSFKGTSGNKYELASYISLDTDTFVFVSSPLESKIVGKIARLVCRIHYPVPAELSTRPTVRYTSSRNGPPMSRSTHMTAKNRRSSQTNSSCISSAVSQVENLSKSPGNIKSYDSKKSKNGLTFSDGSKEETFTERAKEEQRNKTEGEMKAKIQVVLQQPGKTDPIIGYFPSGYDPMASKKLEKAPSVKVFKHKRNSERMDVVVKPPNSKVEFVGTSYSGDAAHPQMCSYALGVLDKKNGILKIVDIAANKIIRLDQKIPEVNKKEEPSTSKGAEQTSADKIKTLNQSYGTKKSVLMGKKSDAIKQIHDPETAEKLKKKVENLKINDNAHELVDGANKVINHQGVPPYNIDATTPQQAYPLDKIILPGDRDCLSDILELVNAGSVLDRNAYPTFVCNRVDKLNNIQDKIERTELACIFSYITHLIKFKDQHSAEASSANNHRIPEIIKQKFMSMFSTPGMRTLTDEKISLLVKYVLVLTLFADDFRTDLLDIASDLRMSIVVLKNHVLHLHLGGKFGKTSYSTLSVPFKFPDHGNTKRRK